MDRDEWLTLFYKQAEVAYEHLPGRFTSEDLREEVAFAGIKLVDDPKFWNAGLNNTLKAWVKAERIRKGSPVKAKRKAARGALVWTYIKQPETK